MMNKSKIKEIQHEPKPNSELKADGLPSAKLLPNPVLAACAVHDEEPHLKTKHNLSFEAAESPYAFFDNHKMFRIGTCTGQWCSIRDCYVIISVINDIPGNGHFDDVLEWFEFSCKRDNKNLLIVECMNGNFYLHLLSKRGFIPVDKKGENCIKVFNKKSYKKMLKNGNELLVKGSLHCR